MNEKHKPLHQQVAEKIIQQLQSGTAIWQKPWGSADKGFRLPYNATSGNRYKGINSLNLLLAGWSDPRWLTFKQADAQGCRIKAGEQGTMIQFVKTKELRTRRDDSGKVLFDEMGQVIKQEVLLVKPIISLAWVFNADQISGLPPLEQPLIENQHWVTLQRAEGLIKASAAKIQHSQGDEAYYDLKTDSITIPLREQFGRADQYYATLLHELGHWTGHEDRLDRSLFNLPGSADYAREELRSEIASMLLGDELRIGHDPAQHIAYVESWIALLSASPMEIHAAALDAEKICAYLLGFERKLLEQAELEQTQTIAGLNTPAKYLTTGDEIAYKGNIYTVNGHLKQGKLRIEERSGGQCFIISPSDGLYKSLLDQKQFSLLPLKQLAPGAHISSKETAEQGTFKIKR